MTNATTGFRDGQLNSKRILGGKVLASKGIEQAYITIASGGLRESGLNGDAPDIIMEERRANTCTDRMGVELVSMSIEDL